MPSWQKAVIHSAKQRSDTKASKSVCSSASLWQTGTELHGVAEWDFNCRVGWSQGGTHEGSAPHSSQRCSASSVVTAAARSLLDGETQQ